MRDPRRIARTGLVLAIAMMAGGGQWAMAGETAAPAAAPAAASAEESPTALYDKIWGFAKLYSDSKNPWIEELSIVGREQVDWYHFDGDKGNADNFANRRTRIGLKAKVLQTVTIHGEVDLNLEGDGETYNKITDAYIKWSPDKRFNLTVGKHGAKFTLDGSTSSTSLITIDRSNVANNFWFPEEYVPGISVSGDWGKWTYNAGYFSSGDANSEFGDFNAGSFVLLSGGYDFGEMAGIDKALVRVDYVYQDPNSGNDFTRSNEDVGSLNVQLEKGPWAFGGDFDVTKGYGSQSDLVGGQLMPSYKFCETWQVVVRYTGISSDDPNGIRFARYENKITSGRGDEYNEIYLGLNKYFYGHKLKIQTGIQYASMHDSANDGGKYEGWGITTGLRTSW